MISRLLIANRGEIACRIIDTCERLGIESVAVYSDADENALHTRRAEHSIRIGGSNPSDSYLNGDAIIAAAKSAQADAIHPGYGFLSENPNFAAEVVSNGITWIGPSPRSMELMADKVEAKKLMKESGVPVLPGPETPVANPEHALQLAETIGWPVIVKASGGGGGMGMNVVRTAEDIEKEFSAAAQIAERYFSNSDVYIEKYVESAKHIEAQVLGLPDGEIIVVGDRDCTLQRRNQKVLEEAPCPVLSGTEREQLYEYAKLAARSVAYEGAGTIEMLLDTETRNMYFLEMNTRIQVEHTITEMVSDIDLVQAQLWITDGRPELQQPLDDISINGHAFEFRICAEDPLRFMPGPGVITEWNAPKGEGIRVDTGYELNDEVTPFYDSLIAKLCVHAATRSEAIDALMVAGSQFRIVGPKNNLDLIQVIAGDHVFRESLHDTRTLAEHHLSRTA